MFATFTSKIRFLTSSSWEKEYGGGSWYIYTCVKKHICSSAYNHFRLSGTSWKKAKTKQDAHSIFLKFICLQIHINSAFLGLQVNVTSSQVFWWDTLAERAKREPARRWDKNHNNQKVRVALSWTDEWMKKETSELFVICVQVCRVPSPLQLLPSSSLLFFFLLLLIWL